MKPNIEQEATSIWRTINDIAFLEEQGYRISLPKSSVVDSMISKSKLGTFGNKDFAAIYSLVDTLIFEAKDYHLAMKKVSDQIGLIEQMITEVDSSKSHWDWKFKMFDKYRIIFTLYGTGGSYDPDDGTITIMTNNHGDFVNYEDPANTIIHEIAHMGMEYSIVQKYNLSHGQKEKLVDTFVFLMFKEKLPQYRIQNMGDNNVDKFLNKKEDIKFLDARLLQSVD